jgi:hypothetical protein
VDDFRCLVASWTPPRTSIPICGKNFRLTSSRGAISFGPNRRLIFICVIHCAKQITVTRFIVRFALDFYRFHGIKLHVSDLHRKIPLIVVSRTRIDPSKSHNGACVNQFSLLESCRRISPEDATLPAPSEQSRRFAATLFREKFRDCWLESDEFRNGRIWSWMLCVSDRMGAIRKIKERERRSGACFGISHVVTVKANVMVVSFRPEEVASVVNPEESRDRVEDK